MTDLKSCHVCGEKPHITAGSTLFRFFAMVSCMDEHHTVQVRAEAKTLEEARQKAIEKWNHRHYPAEVQQAVERMKPKAPSKDGKYQGKCLCGETVIRAVHKFCYGCGQALDWED